MLKNYVVFGYGLSLVVFGSIGYLRSGSFISMIVGGGFGLLMILLSFFMFAGKKWSEYGATALSLLLAAVFTNRYLLTGKTFPLGFAVLSGVLFLFLLVQVRGSRARERIDPKSS